MIPQAQNGGARGVLSERNSHSPSADGRLQNGDAENDTQPKVCYIPIKCHDGRMVYPKEREPADPPPVRPAEKMIPFAFGERVNLNIQSSGSQQQPDAHSESRRKASPVDEATAEKEKVRKQEDQLREGEKRRAELQEEVHKFVGAKSDKQYRYLDAKLERLTHFLDGIDHASLRVQRKELIRKVLMLIAELDDRTELKKHDDEKKTPSPSQHHEKWEKDASKPPNPSITIYPKRGSFNYTTPGVSDSKKQQEQSPQTDSSPDPKTPPPDRQYSSPPVEVHVVMETDPQPTVPPANNPHASGSSGFVFGGYRSSIPADPQPFSYSSSFSDRDQMAAGSPNPFPRSEASSSAHQTSDREVDELEDGQEWMDEGESAV